MIDYGRLDRSVQFYSSKYTRIESPWTVTSAVSDITRPPDRSDWEILGKNKVLVASGEQSFLYLYLKGFLPKGKYQTITPCFRDEPFDVTHTKYFIKNEIIITDSISVEQLEELVSDAQTFFTNELNHQVDRVATSYGFDLECEGIELGSYGIRHSSYLSWIYGTGCAEPRMSIVKKIIGTPWVTT